MPFDNRGVQQTLNFFLFFCPSWKQCRQVFTLLLDANIIYRHYIIEYD